MACCYLKYLLGECFWSPNIAMIQKSSPPEKFGNYVSAYQLLFILAGCASSFSFGLLVNFFNISNAPVMIGRLLALYGSIGYGGAMFSWWKAGKHFDKLKNTDKEVKVAPA